MKFKLDEVLFEEVYIQNQKTLLQLKEELKKDEWMLGLGAGVSISVGLPSWYSLLAKITARQMLNWDLNEMKKDEYSAAYRTAVKKFYQDIKYEGEFLQKNKNALGGGYSRVFEGINVLESAEYIRNFIQAFSGIEDMEKDQKRVNRRIDWTMNWFIQNACEFPKDITQDSVKEELKQSTLGAVAQLMTTKSGNPIYNAITYNYDNLLETVLREVFGCSDDKVHSIAKENELRDLDIKEEWNIYHVHGRIPVIKHSGEESSESVILTESNYYDEERVNYSWTNVVQSYALLRKRMIFIGFSGTDYNFRRIMKYINEEKSKKKFSYIFFSANDIVAAVYEAVRKKIDPSSGKEITFETFIKEMNRKDSIYAYEKLLINHMIYAQTVYWEKKGLKVIWSTHAELPSDLTKLVL